MSKSKPSIGTNPREKRAVRLTGASMECAPTNELGVVYLFSEKSRSLGFRVSQIKPGFPDCIAYRRAGDREQQVRIEFEFRSRSFARHGHDADACDCIVCWEHDWPDCPVHLEVIELRTLFGVPPTVWMQPAIKTQWFWLDKSETCTWAVSPRARIGDLLLMYRCQPVSAITDVYRLEGIQQRKPAEWRSGECFDAPVRRLTRLKAPIGLMNLKTHRVLRTSGFVRGNMQGVRQVSEYWPALFQLIVDQDPVAAKRLAKYSPERLNQA